MKVLLSLEMLQLRELCMLGFVYFKRRLIVIIVQITSVLFLYAIINTDRQASFCMHKRIAVTTDIIFPNIV